MASLIHIRRRIKSAKNIAQITKAMEMVAASKMKKAQDQALSSRPYALKLEEIIGNLASFIKTYDHPLLKEKRNPKKIAVLIISTDKGLCGSLNVNLFRGVSQWVKTLDTQASISISTIGKKARTLVKGLSHDYLSDFSDLPENPAFEDVRPIAKMLIDGFLAGEFDQVFVVYTQFISTLKQEVAIKQLLPIEKTGSVNGNGNNHAYEQKEETPAKDYIFEPDPKSLMDWVLPYRAELTLYQTVLEAKASEQSARMVAMKNANESAKELIGGLTLDYNRERQAQVTNELLDVTTARMALKE